MKQLYLRIRDFEGLGIDWLETLWSSHQVEVDGFAASQTDVRMRPFVCMMMIKT